MHDLNFHDHVHPPLLLLVSALHLLSTSDIDTHANRVGAVLDHLAEVAEKVCDAVENWYDGRPNNEEGGEA